MPPMPPIPPMPPMPPAGGAVFFSLTSSTITHSQVIISEATEEESRRALLTTLVGSIIPASIRLVYLSLAASQPKLTSFCSRSLPTISAPSFPAFSAIVLHGIQIAFLMIWIPIDWSKFSPFKLSRVLEAQRRAQPPPFVVKKNH